MSKAASAPSKTLADQAGSPFVYDFLYQDVRRVGSFLSQFVESGHLQSIKQTTSTEESEQSEAGASAAADVRIARTQGQFSDRVSSGTKDAMERAYDPVWTNAIDLLTHLNARDIIQRDIGQAHTGQFVMATGVLGIIDLALLQTVWGVSAFRETAERAMIGAFQANAGVTGQPKNNQAKTEAIKQAKGIMDLIQKLPHTIQARLATDDGTLLYCPIQADGLTISSTDLILKNGTFVPGIWAMLGILDSFPDAVEAGVAERTTQALGMYDNPFTTILEAMIPLVRNLGRPATALGVTPLLIFREVSL